jgi:hypothetical protein
VAIRTADRRNGAPGSQTGPPSRVAQKNACVIIRGESTIDSAEMEASTPCNSPCWSAPAARLITPCMAGATMAPTAEIGIITQIIQPSEIRP